MINKALGLLIVCLMFSVSSLAKSESAFDILNRQPISVLDLAVLKIKSALQDWEIKQLRKKNGFRVNSSFVSYFQDKKEILIMVQIFDPKVGGNAFDCMSVTRDLKGIQGLNYNVAESWYNQYFMNESSQQAFNYHTKLYEEVHRNTVFKINLLDESYKVVRECEN